MEQGREEEEEELGEEDGGPERALEKSPFQLTAGDVYDISSVVGRDLLQLSAGRPFPAALARLQFRIVRVLEMLEALVSESSLAEEQLRLERDSLRRELEELRAAGARGGAGQVGARAAGPQRVTQRGRRVTAWPLGHVCVVAKLTLTPAGAEDAFAAITGLFDHSRTSLGNFASHLGRRF